MYKSVVYTVGVLALIAAGALYFLYQPKTHAETEPPIKVVWLLSHQPTDVFARATKTFADELAKDSGGHMQLEVMNPQELGYAQGDIPKATIFDTLDSGRAQIASVYTVSLGADDPGMSALTLPFLFKSYGSAEAVLDGDLGNQILGAFNAKAHALAFTMSGGYRIIATKNKKIESLSAMQGLHIATSGGSVAAATLTAFGAVPVSVDLESGAQPFDPDTIDGVETTYSRLGEAIGTHTEYTRYVNETNHSMFLTAIVVSDSFYNSLSPQNQQALRAAARAAALVEREDSIALNESVKAQLAKEGSVISTLSPAATAAFTKAAESVYRDFMPKLGADLVTNIISAQ